MKIYKQENMPLNKTLAKVLEQYSENQTRKGFNSFDLDLFIKAAQNNDKLGNILIKRFVGNGSSALVFETSEGDILKLTVGSHFPLHRPQEKFDVPIKEQGKIGKVYYYIEKMLFQHNMPEYYVAIIKEKIEKAGYKAKDLSDADIHQIGMSESGDLYLLDPECARFKTIFHALWYKLKLLLKNIRPV